MYEVEKEYVRKNTQQDGCVGYAVFNPNGTLCMQGHTACYSGMKADLKNSIIVNRLQKNYNSLIPWGGSGTKESRLLYLDWVLNSSPWADVFITKDAAEALKEELVISTCNVPGPFLLGGMTAMRGLWEIGGNRTVKVFAELLKLGCDPAFAYVMGHCINSSMQLVYYYGGHCSLCMNDAMRGNIVNFIKKQPKKDSEPPFYVSKSYRGVHRYWDDENCGGELFRAWVDRHVAEFNREAEPVAPQYVNPFAPPSYALKNSTDQKVTLPQIAELSKIFFKEFINNESTTNRRERVVRRNVREEGVGVPQPKAEVDLDF